jgi:CRISPR-associated endonuclease/helicase Cas3
MPDSDSPRSHECVPDSPEADWIAAALDRPAWLLWGKAMPVSSIPAHPLLCHMADVAAVAGLLLVTRLPVALQQRLMALWSDPAESLRSLLLVVALHDIGKATPAFQGKVAWAAEFLSTKGFDFRADDGARHHGPIGHFYLQRALSGLGLEYPGDHEFSRAVCAHHGEFPSDRESTSTPPGQREAGNGAWDSARADVVRELTELFCVSELSQPIFKHSDVMLIAGLTSVADWIGSIAEVFGYEKPLRSLNEYWPVALERAERALDIAGLRRRTEATPRSFETLFPGYSPWPLHSACDALAARLSGPGLYLVEAPMGEGKTEAALLLAYNAAARACQAGFFIGLPTQATANQMLGRVQRHLESTGAVASSLVLAHGEASLVSTFQRLRLRGIYSDERPAVAAEEWFLSKKRTLLAQYAVGTIDQALLGVMRVPHDFVRLFGLAGKTVILDEVHAYDTYTGTLLDALLEWLAAMGATVVLLSATLPSKRRRSLLHAYQRGAGMPTSNPGSEPYPRISVVEPAGAHTVHVEPRGASTCVELQPLPEDLGPAVTLLASLAKAGACAGLIVNTVARAQEATQILRVLAPDVPRILLHSRMLPEERLRRELLLERWLGPETRTKQRPAGCVVIGTQVLEQSLDVDFDVLATEIAPIDLVLQRTGRLWRHSRTNRCTKIEKPVLYVLRPLGDPQTIGLNEVAAVYDELAVRRSLEVLMSRSSVVLPGDIEALVEQVYRDIDPEVLEQALLEKWAKQAGEEAAERMVAKQRLIPAPGVDDSPFGDLKVFLREDDDPTVHMQLKAATRLGPPSLELVCVEQTSEGLLVGDGGTDTLDLGAEPDWRLTERLVRRSIGVTTAGVVHGLMKDEPSQPKGWSKSALLRYRRLLAFSGGTAQVAGFTLRLDQELGLCVTRTMKAS